MTKQSNGWYAAAGSGLLRCSFPGCVHTASIITKMHCRLTHGVEREEIEKIHGLPKKVAIRHPFKGEK